MFPNVFPVIVPRSYFALGNWPGRHRLLNHPELAVTWVELGLGTMAYVNVARHDEIESGGRAIHEVAMANLMRASHPLTTHAKTDGNRVIFLAMMHDDGLGTSRLLFVDELSREFPHGFALGIPERSCGFLVPRDVPEQERAPILDGINHCFTAGTVPMLPGLHDPELFRLAAA